MLCGLSQKCGCRIHQAAFSLCIWDSRRAKIKQVPPDCFLICEMEEIIGWGTPGATETTYEKVLRAGSFWKDK